MIGNLRNFRLAMALAIATFATDATVSADTAAEVSVKAAIIHKIAKFVSWPDSAFESVDSPMYFCVIGDSLILDALTKLDGRPIHGRPVVVRRLQEPIDVAAQCDVLYLGGHGEGDAVDWLQPVAESPVLTFGEAGAFGADASIVTMTIRRDKVSFAINLEASDKAGLAISAQLLQLAAAVGRRGS